MDDAKDAIRQRLAEVKTFLARETPPRLSESDTKANFIEPIIAALGWQGIGVVTREYYVRNSQEFIDYVMAGPSGPLLAIEAKQLQTDLTDKHAAQLIQYCAVEGIEWAALTNGRELQFFNSFLKPDLAAKRVLRLDLLAFNSETEFEALFGQIWQLSRESMTKPSGVRTWLNQRRLDTALRAILLDSSSPTIRQLRKALSDAEISATTQDLAQWFRSHLGASVTTLPVASRQSADRAAAQGQGVVDRPSAMTAASMTGESGRQSGIGEEDIVATSDDRGTLLFAALRQALDRQLPETTWRTTKYYTAAESAGHTFLAVRTRKNHLFVGLSLPASTNAGRLTENAGQFNWERITKVGQLATEAEVDDELLVLIEASRDHAVDDRRSKAHYGVALADLVGKGYLLPGAELVLIGPGNREFARALLTSAGGIDWNGTSYRSPSDRAFANPFGRDTLNGWSHWQAILPEGRESLASVRARFLAGHESREVTDSSGPEIRVSNQ